MKSFKYSPSFLEEETKESIISASEGHFSRTNKVNSPMFNSETLFNVSLILASSLILATGMMISPVQLWLLFWNKKIPSLLHLKNVVVLSTPCFALVVSILSPVIAKLSLVKYQQRRKQKSRILLAIILCFASIMLMLLGAALCYRYRTTLPNENPIVGQEDDDPNQWRQILILHLKSLIYDVLPGNKAMQEWDNMQSSLSCCGIHDYQDWIVYESDNPIPSSCCIPYEKAEELAKRYHITDDIVCYVRDVSWCIFGKCDSPTTYRSLYKGPNCALGAVSPIGCVEMLESTLIHKLKICERFFYIFVAAYVIAVIIMGVFFFI